MREEKAKGGTGVEYPRAKEILSVLGSDNIDLKLEVIATKGETSGNKNMEALANAILGITGNFTLREVLFCPDYNCAIDYFSKLDGILNVQKMFFEYKKMEDAQNYFAGKPWDSFIKTYYPG